MFKQGMETAYRDAEIIIRKAIKEVLPDKAVRSVLGNQKKYGECLCCGGRKGSMENGSHMSGDIWESYPKRNYTDEIWTSKQNLEKLRNY